MLLFHCLTFAVCMALFRSQSWVTHGQGKQMIRPLSDENLPVTTSMPMTRIRMWWRSLWLCQWRGLPARLEVINNCTFFEAILIIPLGLLPRSHVQHGNQEVPRCGRVHRHKVSFSPPYHCSLYISLYITIYHYISLYITIYHYISPYHYSTFNKPFWV